MKYSDPTAAVINDNDDNDCDGIVDEELLDGVDNDGDGVIDEDTSANVLYPPMSEEIVLIEEKPENLKIVSAVSLSQLVNLAPPNPSPCSSAHTAYLSMYSSRGGSCRTMGGGTSLLGSD